MKVQKIVFSRLPAGFKDGFIFLVIGKTAIFVDTNTGTDYYYTTSHDEVQYVLPKKFPYFLQGDHGFAMELLSDHIKRTLEVENVAFVESQVDHELLKHFRP